MRLDDFNGPAKQDLTQIHKSIIDCIDRIITNPVYLEGSITLITKNPTRAQFFLESPDIQKKINDKNSEAFKPYLPLIYYSIGQKYPNLASKVPDKYQALLLDTLILKLLKPLRKEIHDPVQQDILAALILAKLEFKPMKEIYQMLETKFLKAFNEELKNVNNRNDISKRDKESLNKQWTRRIELTTKLMQMVKSEMQEGVEMTMVVSKKF